MHVVRIHSNAPVVQSLPEHCPRMSKNFSANLFFKMVEQVPHVKPFFL